MRRSRGGKAGRTGRPRQEGKRTPSGALSRAGKGPVQPNDRVVSTREAFKWFRSGKAGHEAYDPIGRAWLVGLLDGHGIAPEKLRDAARGYGDDYWQYYGRTGPAMVDLEPEARGIGARRATDSDFIGPDPQGEWLAEADKTLLRAGRHIRDALHNVVIDQFFFPDDDPAWLGRLITAARVSERANLIRNGMLPPQWPAIIGALPAIGDRERLKNLVTALRILVTGRVGPAAPEAEEVPSAPPAPPPPLPPVAPELLDDGGRFLKPWPEVADAIRERMASSGETNLEQ